MKPIHQKPLAQTGGFFYALGDTDDNHVYE